jgi:GAF domain-containing protein
VFHPATADPVAPVDDAMQEWRRAAQRVARAWNAWLAAGRRERADAHAAYLEALRGEERAAHRLAGSR